MTEKNHFDLAIILLNAIVCFLLWKILIWSQKGTKTKFADEYFLVIFVDLCLISSFSKFIFPQEWQKWKKLEDHLKIWKKNRLRLPILKPDFGRTLDWRCLPIDVDLMRWYVCSTMDSLKLHAVISSCVGTK